jgi:hypothetical protein
MLKEALNTKAIIILMNHYLGLEGILKDISQDGCDFLRFYRSDACLKPRHNSFNGWLNQKIGKDIAVNEDDVTTSSSRARARVQTLLSPSSSIMPARTTLIRSQLGQPYRVSWRYSYSSGSWVRQLADEREIPGLDIQPCPQVLATCGVIYPSIARNTVLRSPR